MCKGRLQLPVHTCISSVFFPVRISSSVKVYIKYKAHGTRSTALPSPSAPLLRISSQEILWTHAMLPQLITAKTPPALTGKPCRNISTAWVYSHLSEIKHYSKGCSVTIPCSILKDQWLRDILQKDPVGFSAKNTNAQHNLLQKKGEKNEIIVL